MQKIMIIGPGNAGKSTLARKLGEKLGLKVYHLDQYFWLPNWVPKEKAEWEADHLKIIQNDSWIAEGDFGKLYDIRAQHADTIIFLNLPRRVIIPRSLLRRLKYYGQTRPDMTKGNVEKFNLEYLNWLYKYNRTRAHDLIAKYKDSKTTIILKSRKDIESFLRQL